MSKKIIIPVTYTVDSTYQNERFIKLRIDVCHEGINKNGSNFSMDGFEKSKETIKNIPILAYVKKTEDGEDFDGHNVEYDVDDKGNPVVTYLEQPVGVIPETNEYTYIEKDGRTYVQVVGYVWRKYTNVVEDIIEKRQSLMVSMEIMVTDYDNSEDGIININDYFYTGITLLGEDVNPAMFDSEARVEKFALSFEEREGRIKEMAQELKKIKIEFELSLEDKRNRLYDALWRKYQDTSIYVYPVATYDNHVVYQTYNSENGEVKYFDIKYEEVDDNIVLAEESIRVYPRFLTQEQINKLADDEKKFAKLNEEVISLREFKQNIEYAQVKAQKEDIIESFSSLLDKDIIDMFTEKIDEYSVDELKSQLSVKFAEKELSKQLKSKNSTVRTALDLGGSETKTIAI